MNAHLHEWMSVQKTMEAQQPVPLAGEAHDWLKRLGDELDANTSWSNDLHEVVAKLKRNVALSHEDVLLL